jgi:hypothetical protein
MVASCRLYDAKSGTMEPRSVLVTRDGSSIPPTHRLPVSARRLTDKNCLLVCPLELLKAVNTLTLNSSEDVYHAKLGSSSSYTITRIHKGQHIRYSKLLAFSLGILDGAIIT